MCIRDSIPERSVVLAGDLLFNGGTPFALMGSISGWIEVLETVLRPLGALALLLPYPDEEHADEPGATTKGSMRERLRLPSA